MNKLNIQLVIVLIISVLGGGCLNKSLIKTDHPLLDRIQLPPGFHIDLFAEGVKNARSMVRGDQGTIFVGTRSKGKVYALVDRNGDFRADTSYTLAQGLTMPNGLAFRNGDLYVAEVDKIWLYGQIENHLADPPQPKLINGALPSNKWHGWKYIAFGPDNKLYIPIGAPCNICEKQNPIYATIQRMNADGTQLEPVAFGIRNSVGFDWHPETGDFWFTENGRDMMGNDLPHDELNRASQTGLHFGYPYCHEGDVPDPRFGSKRACDEFVPPVQKLAPHTAALAMKFYAGSMFPAEYRHNIFIAEHGSWNRDIPIGYRITRVVLSGNRAIQYEPFATGWLNEGEAWGRPVDLLILPDGSLLVSDDHADAVYRIWYE